MLFFIAFSAMALEQSDIDLIDEFAIVTSKVKMQDGDWGINVKAFDRDDTAYGVDQFRDLTDWKNIRADSWFDLDTWIKDRELKDKLVDWRVYMRNKLSSELAGRVIKCLGVCQYFHELRPINAKSRTVLREGDEFITKENSFAWINLVDGTLLRVSPKTSLTLTEVNIAKKETFFLIRLNHGYVNVISRRQGVFEQVNKSDTDLGFYPLWEKNANREYYSIEEFRKFDETQKILYEITENPGYISQTKKLNQYLNEDAKDSFEKKSTLYLYTPTYSLITSGTNVNMFYAVNGEGHFKVYNRLDHFTDSDKREQTAVYQLRGYQNKEKTNVDFDKWYQVNANGLEASQNDELTNTYASSEGFLKRLTTIYLAREILIEKFSKELLSSALDEKELTKKYGYRLWGDELSKRKEFLDEYIRRVETTNIDAIAQVFQNTKVEKFDHSYYAYAMKQHYIALRGMYAERNKAVAEMTDAQYYLWVLKYAK